MFSSLNKNFSNGNIVVRCVGNMTRRQILIGLLSLSLGGSVMNLSSFAQPFSSCLELELKFKYEREGDSYTQGLLYEYDHDLKRGILYESGGRYGRSLLRKFEANTGKILKEIKIPDNYFAEGLAVVENHLFMLTWRERTCLVYDKESFELIDEFRYSGEGWGITFDGEYLIMSDGSSTIRFLDPKTFRQVRTVKVFFEDLVGRRQTVNFLNELEFVNGEIWSNIYQQDYVVRIDPKSGRVIGKALNFSRMVPDLFKGNLEYVLNGLAFDKQMNNLYVTGKCWPVVYVFSISTKK